MSDYIAGAFWAWCMWMLLMMAWYPQRVWDRRPSEGETVFTKILLHLMIWSGSKLFPFVDVRTDGEFVTGVLFLKRRPGKSK